MSVGENENVLESLSKGNSGDEYTPDSNPNCNLIVNYLPHDIDDAALRVCFFYSFVAKRFLFLYFS